MSVVLHVAQGLVCELEVFADDDEALAAADVTDLSDPEVG